MSEQKTEQDQVLENLKAFQKEMRDLFNKHVKTFASANDQLALHQIEKFKEIYESQSKEDLVEMVEAQHIAYNLLNSHYITIQGNFRKMVKEVAMVTTAEEFAAVKKKAEMTIMAQNLVDQGKSPEDVRKMLEGEHKAIFANEQSIITH